MKNLTRYTETKLLYNTMRYKIFHENSFKFIEYIFFIGFSIAAGWFASGVLKQFFSEKTSFSQYEEKVTNYPVVSVKILGHQASEVNLSNVMIHYKVVGGMSSFQKLQIGTNHFHNDKYNKTEKAILESLENSNGERVFRIIHTTPILEKKTPWVIIEIHTKVVKNFQDFTSDLAVFYLTSRKNSPGFIDFTWNDLKNPFY